MKADLKVRVSDDLTQRGRLLQTDGAAYTTDKTRKNTICSYVLAFQTHTDHHNYILG